MWSPCLFGFVLTEEEEDGRTFGSCMPMACKGPASALRHFLVATGTVKQGIIRPNATLLLGESPVCSVLASY